MCELKPVIIDSLWNTLYAVCLYGAYRELDTLSLLLYYELLVSVKYHDNYFCQAIVTL